MHVTDTNSTQRAFAYCRVSASSQAEYETFSTHQAAAIQAFCAKNDVVIAQIYSDRGMSDGRPALTAMMHAIEAQLSDIDKVIVLSLSRLSRSLLELESIQHRLQRHGVELISISEAFTAADWITISALPRKSWAFPSRVSEPAELPS